MLIAPRIAANTKIAGVYSNNSITQNKREMMRMPNFNRKFLPEEIDQFLHCLLYTSPSPRDATLSRMPSSA